jgi:Zn-dependent protease
MTQTGDGYNYSFHFNPQPIRTKRRVYFSVKELKHIAVAAALVMCIGFSIGFYENLLDGSSYWTLSMMAVFAVCMTASFLVHEIGHKIMAQKSGLWAEFRLTMWGALLTLASVFLPFKMISPGAMMIGGSADRKSLLKISVAGPITNIIFSLVFFGLAFSLPIEAYTFMVAFLYAAYVNAFMAVFNLIPFGILDGYKIFSINKKVWAAVFIPSLLLTIFSYALPYIV